MKYNINGSELLSQKSVNGIIAVQSNIILTEVSWMRDGLKNIA